MSIISICQKHLAAKKFYKYIDSDPILDIEQQWAMAKRVFQKSKTVYPCASNAARLPVEYAVFAAFLSSEGAIPCVINGLSCDNPQVVGYCLAALSKTSDPAKYRSCAPENLFKRDESIRVQQGSLFQVMSLGTYAEQVLHGIKG